jgi:tetratricopeptide (TPR) repeat protein
MTERALQITRALLGAAIALHLAGGPAQGDDETVEAVSAAVRERPHDDAERDCRTIVSRPVTADDRDLAFTLLSCGNVALRRAHLDEAARRYDLSLGIARRLNDAELRIEGEAALALLALGRGRYDEAERRFGQLLQQYGLGGRADDELKERLLNNLGGVYERLGKLPEAERVWLEAVVLAERRLGSAHQQVGTKLDNLAALYGKMRRWSESDAYAERAIRILADRLGDDHPTVARALDNLGRRLAQRDRHADAERLHRRALAIFTREEGPGHPDVAVTLMNLAVLALAQGRDEAAEHDATQALDIRRRALGKDHPATLESLTLLQEIARRRPDFTPARRRAGS